MFKKIVLAPVRLVKKGTDKVMQAAVIGLIRHALTTFGGGLVTNGTLADSDFQAAVGALMTLVGIVWSVIEKRNAAKTPAA